MKQVYFFIMFLYYSLIQLSAGWSGGGARTLSSNIMEFSPDGKKIIYVTKPANSDYHKIIVQDILSKKIDLELTADYAYKEMASQIHSIEISPDNSKIICLAGNEYNEQFIRIWDLNSGVEIDEIIINKNKYWLMELLFFNSRKFFEVEYSEEENALFFSAIDYRNEDFVLLKYDLEQKELSEVLSIENQELNFIPYFPHIHENAKFLSYYTFGDRLKIYDIKSDSIVNQIRFEQVGDIDKIILTDPADYAAFYYGNVDLSQISLVNLREYEIIKEFEFESDYSFFKFGFNNNEFYYLDPYNFKLVTYDMKMDQLENRLLATNKIDPLHKYNIFYYSLKFALDNDLIAYTFNSSDNECKKHTPPFLPTIMIESLKDRIKPQHLNIGHFKPVEEVAFSYNSQYIVSTAEDGQRIIWDLKTGEQIWKTYMNANIMFPKEQNEVWLWGSDNIQIMDFANDSLVKIIDDPALNYMYIEVNYKMDLVMTRSQEFVYLYTLPGMAIDKTIPINSEINQLTFIENGSRIVGATSSNHLYFWDVESGILQADIDYGPKITGEIVDFSNNGLYVSTIDAIYSLADGSKLNEIIEQTISVYFPFGGFSSNSEYYITRNDREEDNQKKSQLVIYKIGVVDPVYRNQNANYDLFNIFISGDNIVFGYCDGIITVDNLDELLASDIDIDGLSGNQTVISPNPFSTSITINVKVPAPSLVNISIYDMTGRMIAVVYDGRSDAGDYHYKWEPESLSPGAYLCRITMDGGVQSQIVIHSK